MTRRCSLLAFSLDPLYRMSQCVLEQLIVQKQLQVEDVLVRRLGIGSRANAEAALVDEGRSAAGVVQSAAQVERGRRKANAVFSWFGTGLAVRQLRGGI